MPRKKKAEKKTITVLNEDDVPVETTEAGVPGFVQPGEWDIKEELEGLDTFLEHNRDVE